MLPKHDTTPIFLWTLTMSAEHWYKSWKVCNFLKKIAFPWDTRVRRVYLLITPRWIYPCTKLSRPLSLFGRLPCLPRPNRLHFHQLYFITFTQPGVNWFVPIILHWWASWTPASIDPDSSCHISLTFTEYHPQTNSSQDSTEKRWEGRVQFLSLQFWCI